ncbi:hypothetical protein FSW04_24770 [Baekduia soli]|uniref:Uncharacterized protein n=1 Tax=Baekduia soli TaxID=496014 RepID=A0A5B8UBB1_9ACTN|nr:hypothetical protein [Baekduia soli]QEC50473.1 hypothetical protein FSW04_24770 [Baekduia soli]
MFTGLIIVIVVVALALLATIAFLVPRSRALERERAVARRRREVAEAHREVADDRVRRAEQAERIARSERAEAELHRSRAELHEDGLADEDLDVEHDRLVRGEDAGADRRFTREDEAVAAEEAEAGRRRDPGV